MNFLNIDSEDKLIDALTDSSRNYCSKMQLIPERLKDLIFLYNIDRLTIYTLSSLNFSFKHHSGFYYIDIPYGMEIEETRESLFLRLKFLSSISILTSHNNKLISLKDFNNIIENANDNMIIFIDWDLIDNFEASPTIEMHLNFHRLDTNLPFEQLVMSISFSENQLKSAFFEVTPKNYSDLVYWASVDPSEIRQKMLDIVDNVFVGDKYRII